MVNQFVVVLGILCIALLAVVFVLLGKLRTYAAGMQSIKTTTGEIDIQEQALLERIERGFDVGEFKMYLQFIVDTKSRQIVSAEALSRWETEDGSIVPPGQYIGAMEKHGLIARLDYLMFEKACEKLSLWRGTALGDLNISCNFTRITISETDFVEKIKTISDKYDFECAKLFIEITEDSIEENLEAAMANIRRTKEFGFQVTLDDIGSGYNSLINLCEYPLDIVKIDRQILLHAASCRGKKLFMGIVDLAHNLNLKVVCEGVETQEQNDLVVESGCDYIQGWYYSKALPEQQAEEFAAAYRADF